MRKIVIFSALFMVFNFRRRIKDFLQEDVLRPLFRRLSGNQNIDVVNMEAGEVVEPLTPLSPSPKTTSGSEYEVFLCFRGEDTRKGFTGHLYEALDQHGIPTFMDSQKLEKGEEINKLTEYIDRSKIIVPVFSKRFAESRWCLEEVTKSVECGKEIVPVFFGVEPSDVRNQSGPFKNAFKEHESDKKMNQKEVKKWREALKKVGSLSGFTLKDMNGDEAKLKREIVERVQSKVNKKPLEVAKHPIGIETRVEEVKKMLENGGNYDHHVHVVGILGMGGLGKTTIAKAVYNDLAEGFSGNTCFLSNIRESAGGNTRFPSNIRESAEKCDGLVTLQKRLLGDILKVKDISLSGGVAEGKILIKERASRKRVLLILDDVDSKKQLDALAGGRDWFGSGSVIIITTRNETVLRDHKVKEHEIYKPEFLNEDQSRELFLQHAFNGEEPEGEYLRLSNEVVAAAGGLPLTIEVLGSLLTCDKDVKEWKDILEKLKRIPPSEVQQRLKLSYDSLDDMEKKIFLDISCFFIGWNIIDVTYMWEACDWCPNASIRVLEQRSLIKMEEEGQVFWMHDQIRDMGREIVKEESSRKLQNQSRLWNYQDSWNLLQKKVPMSTEGIMLSVEEGKPPFSAPRLQEWHDLRMFHIEGAKFEGSLHFPEDLKWLVLGDCQLQLPASVSIPKGIVLLDLYGNDDMANVLLDKCGSKSMVFDKLKILSLNGTRIAITPDFSSVPCLVELYLKVCEELVEVHETVGQLKSLVRLDLTGCRKLEILPDTICNLTSLEFLFLSCCDKLLDLPKELGNLASLRCLNIGGSMNLRSLPYSMRKLQFLEHLINSLDGGDLVGGSWIKTRSHDFFDALPDPCCRTKTELELIDDEVEEFTNSFTRFENLESLILKCNSLKALPAGLGRLKLKVLEVYSDNLMLLDDALPLESTEKLVLKCASLEHVSSFCRKTENLKHLNLDCKTMEVIPDWIESSGKLETLELKGYKNMELKFPPEHLEQLSIGFTRSLQQIGCCSTLKIPYVFKKLKILRLVGIPMTATPHFSCFPCLEELMLTNCKQLIEVNESIGTLKKLKFLKIIGCNMLGRLPESICELASLEILDLKGCTSLSNLPEQLGDKMEFLKQLCLDETGIRSLLAFVGKLTRLQSLSIMKCQSLESLPESLCYLDSLRELHVIDNRTSKFIMSLGRLEVSTSWELMDALPRSCCESVHSLKFTNERIEKLTDSIGQFVNLKSMRLRCMMLKALPDFIGQLKYLGVLTIQCHTLTLFDKICMLESIQWLTIKCIKLEPLPFSSTTLLGTSTASGWENIKEVEPPLVRQSECFSQWSSKSVMKKLKFLSLCAKQMTVTPDFSVAPSLKRLTLTGCEMLTEVHHSIGTLENLKHLSITGCNALEGLPNTICHLTSLETLHLSQEFNPSSPPEPSGDLDNHGLPETGIFKSILTCTGQLTQLEHLQHHLSLLEWIGKLENLSLLRLECSSLETLPDCIASLGGLRTLRISGCKNIKGFPDSMSRLEELTSLDLSRTGILELPPWLGCLTHLTSLDLSRTGILELPPCISNFSKLKVLNVSGCEQLVSIPHLSSPVLQELNVSGCRELHSILPPTVLGVLNASNCMNLRGLPDFWNWWSLRCLFLGGCNSLESISDFKPITRNINELSLPGPSGVIQCSNLSDDFKNEVFVGASFQDLRKFMMTGNVIGRSHTGQQHLSFLFPDLSCNRYVCACLGLSLGGISSPVHVAVRQGGRVLFETTLAEDEFKTNDEGFGTFSFREGDEIFEHLQEGAATILVSMDVSNLSTARLSAWMSET